MIAQNYGRIVNIASIAGKEGNPNASAYSASKAGVISLVSLAANQLDAAFNVSTQRFEVFEQHLLSGVLRDHQDKRKRRVEFAGAHVHDSGLAVVQAETVSLNAGRQHLVDSLHIFQDFKSAGVNRQCLRLVAGDREFVNDAAAHAVTEANVSPVGPAPTTSTGKVTS
jgi:hypothetical protein